ncbi:MAG: FeoA family protein [Clostridia bacterium]|nr:FeoA family protein [Clostridia bacterium]
MQELSLDKCEKGLLYNIKKIACSHISVARRLTELGFIVGNKLKIVGFSALKKTLLVEIDGYILSLRSSVAAFVKVNI